MALTYPSEAEEISVSKVTSAVESIQKHNMAELLTRLERKKVEVDFGELPPEIQSTVRDMMVKNHWCTRALSAIIRHIPQ